MISFYAFLQGARVTGKPLLKVVGEVERNSNGHGNEQHATNGSKNASALLELLISFNDSFTGEGNGENGKCGANGKTNRKRY